jgi:hypothetical protein
MEYFEDRSQSEADSESQEYQSEGFECLNYYPGMIAEWNERDEEFREGLFMMEFFGDAECFETTHP